MDTTRRTALLAPLAAAGCSTLAAPASGETAYAVPFTAVIPLTARANGVSYLLYVRTPPDYSETSTRYPLIVTLDADYSFAFCANHLEHLADRMSQAPKTILVSIAYAGAYPDVDRYHANRTRDYTPIFWPDGGYGPTFQANSGHGPAFQRIIADEILPLIDARYRTDSNERTLVGHSYGGLFTGWMLHTAPQLFNRYLLVSPSLWYANKWMFDREAERASTRLPRKTRVYLGVGSWEEQPQNGGFMVSECERFAAMLRGRGDPNLVVEQRTFEDETHASIFPAAFSTGIRHLFNTMD